MRPTERPPPASETLRDDEIADWLERHERAALLFWDETDPAGPRFRARLELVAAASEIPLGIIDVRHDPLVAQALGVKSVPTTIVFRAGEVVERLMGAPPEAVLREALR